MIFDVPHLFPLLRNHDAANGCTSTNTNGMMSTSMSTSTSSRTRARRVVVAQKTMIRVQCLAFSTMKQTPLFLDQTHGLSTQNRFRPVQPTS